MNKLFSFTLATAGLAASALASSAYAQSSIDPHWYVGGGVGQAYANPNKADYSDLRAGASSSTSHDKGTAWKVYGGMQLTPVWGLELEYADLGHYHNDYSLASTGGLGQGTNKLSAWSLAGTGTWPINNAFSLHAKAGLALVRSEYNFSGGGGYTSDNASDLSANPMFGVGAMYKLNKNFAIRFDYENYGKVGKSTGNLTTLGATGEARPSLVSASVQYNF